jgi:hypothetical protein
MVSAWILGGFCIKSVRNFCFKPLILLERLGAALFLRAFREKTEFRVLACHGLAHVAGGAGDMGAGAFDVHGPLWSFPI